MYGPQRLIQELKDLGYEVDSVAAGGATFAVIEGYEIPVGRFKGKTIDLALPATVDFPRSVGASIHVRANPPPFDYSDTVPGKRNIIASGLGPDWRYWSHNFGWNGAERSARRLLNQIKGIFANA